MQQIGKPSEPDQWFVQNANAKAFLDHLPASKPRPLAERVPNAPRGLVDLAERMLAFNPRSRLPIAQSVQHTAFDDYREDDLELRAGARRRGGSSRRGALVDASLTGAVPARRPSRKCRRRHTGYRVEMDDVENVTLDKAAIRALLWRDIRAFQRNSEPVGDRATSPDDPDETDSSLHQLSNCYTMTTPPDTSIFRYDQTI